MFFCLLATSSFLVMELDAVFEPAASAGCAVRAWIDNHRDQVIIVGSLAVGFWLAGHSIFLIVTE